ncbi:hypothetical protein BFJ66_g11747 [Fusarium oxysporum f. sp. cepae]|uniref:Uncharacterized protein n=1 Tax=Fusarium oxysporum f. sp. cepae TaxID=396571 RepID=A0A3L6N696_FUSOX|nr:hypothetical protein BFJ65_g12331 [Fusarium oxysporum f. sp. cepae]RKK32769.1 hypothetical protein BFJ67_g14593 [Fusarium oxysporum f. sp. cepae]RKK39935.1 hypothetical protein BFJ66_g11747 [Fusarium oxysporum f. sp. cepae]
MFWGLHKQLSTKVGLVALIGLSIFAFVASVIKTILLQSLGYRSDFTISHVHCSNLSLRCTDVDAQRGKHSGHHGGFNSNDPTAVPNSNETKSSTYEMDGYRNNRVNSNTFRRIMINAIDTTSEENIMPREEQGITIQTDIVVEYEEEETGKVPSDQTGPNIWV